MKENNGESWIGMKKHKCHHCGNVSFRTLNALRAHERECRLFYRGRVV